MAEPDLLSIYYTVASIIVIYQMFLLQGWTARVDASRDSMDRASKLAHNDLGRVETEKGAKRLLADFPLVPSLALLAVLLILVTLAIYVAGESAQNPVLTMTPAFALAGASIFSLVFSNWNWGRVLREFVKSS